MRSKTPKDPVAGTDSDSSGSEPRERPDGQPDTAAGVSPTQGPPREIGGRGGLDPCRYGDWEKDGRCIDF
jgi:hypothetical protein